MSVTGHEIVVRQRDLVQDIAATRWQDPEVLRWLNDGLRELCLKRPSAYSRHVTMTLAAASRQSIMGIPGAWSIVDVQCNVGVDDAPGRSIRRVSVSDLDAISPAWRTAEGMDVRHWAPDQEPHTFHVFPGRPKQSTTRRVDVVVAQTPLELQTLNAPIPVDDIFAPALGYYLAYRMYSKDAEPVTAERAAAYYAQFTNSI